MRASSLALVAVVVASGCRKPSSAEFYQLESSYSIAVARDGEAAYESAEMDEILTRLKGITERYKEHPRAQQLVATIEAERARIRGERQAREALDNQPAPPPPTLTTPGAQALAVKASGDAGTPVIRPVDGMSEADFIKAFGACTSAGGQREIPGRGKHTQYGVTASAACRKLLEAPEGNAAKFFLFKDGTLRGTFIETTTVTRVEVDAGAPPPPGEPERLLPGMPGYVSP